MAFSDLVAMNNLMVFDGDRSSDEVTIEPPGCPSATIQCDYSLEGLENVDPSAGQPDGRHALRIGKASIPAGVANADPPPRGTKLTIDGDTYYVYEVLAKCTMGGTYLLKVGNVKYAQYTAGSDYYMRRV